MKQDPRVSYHSQQYLRYMLPSFCFLTYFDIQKKLLLNFGKQKLAAMIQLFGTIFHAILNYIFIKYLKYEVVGIAVSTSISNFMILVIIMIYTYRNPKFNQTFIMPRFYMFNDILEYIRLAIPSLLMVCLPWWGFEAQFFIASQVSLTAAAAQVIMANICSLAFQIPLGFSIASCIVVGSNLGAGRGQVAKSYA